MSAPVTAPTQPTARPPASRSLVPRAQYVELKANVHKKLLNRLNLEALALVDRARAESEIRGLVGELLAEDNTPISLGERDLLLGEVMSWRLTAAGALILAGIAVATLARRAS